MSVNKIIDSIGHVDDDMIAETDALRMNKAMKGKSTKYGKIKGWAAAAACLCFVIIGAAALSPFGLRDGDSKNENDGISSKMIGFFIYEGRCYVQYREIYEDVDLIDKHLGTVTGLIDEWTPEDGYVDFAGSAQGDFYSVKGYDPSFMLCMREPDGAINLFICKNGITLKYGSELFEDRLHLAGNYSKVLFESYDSWNYGKEELFRLEGKDETVSRFVECLDEAEFIPENSVSFYDEIKELYHLYFVKNDGVTVELRLCEKGYVRFQGILDVCLRLPEEEYDSFLKLLDSGIGNNADSIRNSAGITLTDCMNDSMLGKYVPEYTVLLSHGLRNTAETAGQVQ